MLSNATKYAIRATLYLAVHSDEKNKIRAKEIAAAIDSPVPFLAKLLQQLQRKNIVSSTKGPHGGFYLSELNRKGTVWNIINCLDGVDKIYNCFLGLSKCHDSNPCPIHDKVVPFRESLLKEFKEKNLAQLAEEIDKGGTFISVENL
jgi:Rrf2 family protein